MELVGEQTLALPRERVWQSLNDPDVLKRCVPGCDTFERETDTQFKVGVTAAVGPVKARFNGKLTLADIQPLTSYALAFEGSGGAAGFGKGNARVSLVDVEGGSTRLTYTVNAQVGGKLAQVGSRLIDGVARKMADEFFSRFAKAVMRDEEPAAAIATGAMASSGSAAADSPTHPATPRSATAIETPSRPSIAAANLPAPQQDASRKSLVTTMAVICAAISTLAAAVAVLAAAVAVLAAAMVIHAAH